MSFPFLSVLVLFVTAVQHSYQMSLHNFVTLSYEEKQALDKFKDLVSSRLPHDYMRKDIYLISWLREVDFNIPAAEKIILDMVRWREENRMDHILEEDLSYFEDEYKGYIEGCDNEGRPIISLYVGDWDIRKAVVAGQSEQLRRYSDKIFESAVVHVRRMLESGQNVTQVMLIFDLNNFSLISHACPMCISLYIHILVTFQTRYPGYIHKIFVVNTPQFALPLWNSYKYLVSPSLRDVLKIYGKNRDEWQEALLAEADPSQLSRHFGGTRLEALDYQDFCAMNTVFRCTQDWKELAG